MQQRGQLPQGYKVNDKEITTSSTIKLGLPVDKAIRIDIPSSLAALEHRKAFKVVREYACHYFLGCLSDPISPDLGLDKILWALLGAWGWLWWLVLRFGIVHIHHCDKHRDRIGGECVAHGDLIRKMHSSLWGPYTQGGPTPKVAVVEICVRRLRPSYWAFS